MLGIVILVSWVCALSPEGNIPLPLSKPLTSVNFAASSSLRKSLVFWARSFLWTVESRW